MADYPCITCKVNVTARAHAIACDVCGRWSHRKHTNITHQQYLQLRRGEIELEWVCDGCKEQHNSTRTDLNIPLPLQPDFSPLRSMTTRPSDTIPDDSFNITREYQQPVQIHDESLKEPSLTPDIPEDDRVVTFEIVDSGTKRGAQKLVGSDGFTYTKGVKSGDRQYWRCSVRNKALKCAASVKQYHNMFTPGLGGHNHPADPGAAKNLKISKKVKEAAKDRLFEPTTVIVERIMKEMTTDNDVNLPNPSNLARAANHHRRLQSSSLL